MNRTQIPRRDGEAPKRTLAVLVVLGAVYFAAFLWPNNLGARTESMLGATSIDEPVTYPYVVRMISPPKDLRDLYTRWVVYGDYHYGYPFYFFSALTVLPVELVHGAAFTNFTSLNLLLLRQLISVLPMILAAGLITFLQTRFQSLWKSVFLFVLILSVRGIVRSNIQWWHPDALSVLAIVLTLFWLEHDQLRFGRNFLLAAVACAFAIGIKLAGVFLAPAIALYLLAGWIPLPAHLPLRAPDAGSGTRSGFRGAEAPQKRLTLGQAAVKAALFLGVMLLTLFVTNPFLLNSGARADLVRIQTFKTVELAEGYAHDDPYYYQKGPAFWEWTLNTWFAHPLLLGLLGLSVVAGSLWGQRRLLNRLILAWVIPYSIYLLWFVAVKPDHYWLPVMVPLYSAALALWDCLPAALLRPMQLLNQPMRWQRVLQAGLLVILLAHFSWNLLRPYSGIIARYQESLTVENIS